MIKALDYDSQPILMHLLQFHWNSHTIENLKLSGLKI